MDPEPEFHPIVGPTQGKPEEREEEQED